MFEIGQRRLRLVGACGTHHENLLVLLAVGNTGHIAFGGHATPRPAASGPPGREPPVLRPRPIFANVERLKWGRGAGGCLEMLEKISRLMAVAYTAPHFVFDHKAV